MLFIHVNPPGSSRSLPEMQPDSCTPGSETEPPGCENTKKKKKNFQTIIFVHMYGNNGHLLLEGNLQLGLFNIQAINKVTLDTQTSHWDGN